MPDYVSLKATAKKLITDAGQSVTVTRKASTSFDPVTGVDTVTTSTFTGYGVGFDYKLSEIDGALIVAGDIRLTLEATATAPIVGDTVTYQGTVYRVMSVNTLSPGGTVLRYEVQLRK